eukprot:CAMPEP_0185207364 /NCGR_PEP_ID=MMETSP1140-20130426/60126_1 /TAXON_ID=298111 /ORGANISM="Pavlova sp., Strain CCMP459" /LENGTH=108 /DNA_ID=CAMNT_0027775047 /DNA_START=159 /DNA_END=481 /DNA_ORIENTATION=-
MASHERTRLPVTLSCPRTSTWRYARGLPPSPPLRALAPPRPRAGPPFSTPTVLAAWPPPGTVQLSSSSSSSSRWPARRAASRARWGASRSRRALSGSAQLGAGRAAPA